MNQYEPVLLDTSIWIASFKGNPSNIKEAVQQILYDDLALTCGPVLFEIRRGLRPSERENILPLLDAVTRLPFNERDWEDASLLDSSLRANGITVPPMDVLIAHVSIKYKVPLFTLDKHFDRIAGIEIYNPVNK